MTLQSRAGEPTQTYRRPRFAIGLAGLCSLLASASCVDAVSAVGDRPSPADAKVAQLAEALAARFTSPERSGRYEAVRRRLVNGALTPAGVYGDSSVWSASVPPATRALTAHGALTERGYRFEINPDGSMPMNLGDARHAITLRRLSDNEFRWNAAVDFAIGSLTAGDAAALVAELLAGGHDHDPATIRTDANAAFPRSGAVLSRVFTIDSLTMHAGAQGTTTINITVGIRAEGLRATSPHFADYIRKYVTTSRYRFSLMDASGAMYFDAVGGDQRLTLRYRVKDGTIVSNLGPPRALPDSLRLASDLSMHVKIFDVGWKDLVTDFVIRRTEHSRSWTILARSEPTWRLPLITERLLRSPLRRPFQGEGAMLEMGVTDSAGAQTLLYRRSRLEVRESPILRFLGGLVTRVFDDLDTSVEREEAAYVRELMVAFQQDAHALLSKKLPENQNATDHRSAAFISIGSPGVAWSLPRPLSLELCVLPNSGGQCLQKARTMPLSCGRGAAPVELRGIEPLTSAMRMQRSPS